jgi:dethiobiotin synthetase
MLTRLFISATGTSSGKTFVARGLTAALSRLNFRVAALKPFETGCKPDPLDALALATAARAPNLARDPAFYRVRPPLSPYAASLSGEAAPDFAGIVRRIREIGSEHDQLIVEGAGGLLVPLDRERDMSDLVVALACPLLLVAPNRLGVLSHALAAVESARTRNLQIAGLVLTEPDLMPDPSSATNLRILLERLALRIFSFPHCPNDDGALADAAVAAGLVDLVRGTPDPAHVSR